MSEPRVIDLMQALKSSLAETAETAEEVPQLKRGMVWCTTCKRSQRVDAGRCLSKGWPECCGYTMTIDSPEERIR